jgi:hypothetical protein
VKTADDIYVRFHGTKRWYRHDYTKEELAVWTERLRRSGAKAVGVLQQRPRRLCDEERSRASAAVESAAGAAVARVSSSVRAYARELAIAGGAATLLSGIPSTVHALVTGRDVTAATRAAGAMLIAPAASLPALFAAAALVHVCVSFFWAAILIRVLPRKAVLVWAILASAAIGWLDLRLIATAFFPEVARLEVAPQIADHLMWGATLGVTLVWLRRHRG